jgi:aminopeptidase N
MSALTRVEAATRAEAITVEAYEIDLDLTIGEEEFLSISKIRFRAAPGTETFVELKPVALRDATLNGKPIDPATVAENRLPLTDLAELNELVISCRMAYSRTGEGLHRYVDPADKEVYLYANTFLDDAQRVFACFDQPDLKAPFTLRVIAPTGWTVLSNGKGTETSPGQWEFVTTPPLATYFFTVCAGPYHGATATHDGIELGLWARKSLAQHLDRDAAEMFTETGQCFDYYHANFGIRYPFGKYDQVFVPEFNAGAMENAGCVTFRDEYIFTSAVTDAEREERADVIAHEMAHMWFGDLVTMRWWDDLWLNESFAEYMGSRTLAANTRWTESWTTFAVSRKSWGYNTDQSPSTHPVAPESVENTELALLNFDGISYAKGASVLRQLVAWLGEDVFNAGLRDHFATNKFGNATLADLLRSLEKASGRDLHLWADLWLRRPQVNTLELAVEPGPDADTLGPVIVVQTAEKDYPTLRPHRINLGLYDLVGDETVLREAIPVEIEVTVDGSSNGADTPVPSLAGARRPDLMLLNDGDLTFAKVRLDGHSMTQLPETLPRLRDPLARAVIWNSLIRGVRDAIVPGSAVISLLAASMGTETHVGVLGDLFGLCIGRAQGQRQNRASVLDAFMDPGRQEHGQELVYQALRQLLVDEPARGPRQLVATRALIAATQRPEEAALLRQWLAGADTPAGLSIDQQLRWLILYRLAAIGAADRDEIDAEHANDRTAEGDEWSTRCRAALPDAAGKAATWDAVMNDDSLSNRQLEALSAGFWQPGATQATLTEPYIRRFFEEAPGMAQRRTPSIVSFVGSASFPSYVYSPQVINLAEEMLAKPGLSPVLHRVVVDAAAVTRRVIAARALDAAALPA